MNQILFELVEHSTEIVEKENWQYYYQIDDYKFNNVYLANWFEKETNRWAAFVARQTDSIKQQLKNKTIDLNRDYNLDFLKKLSLNNNLRLFFSGGGDSLSILDLAYKNDIVLDEIVSIVTGDDINKKENHEIVNLAIEELKNYNNFDSHIIITHSREIEKKLYKDPYIFYKLPEVGSEFPIFRRMWNFENFNNKTNVFGFAKPELLFYKNNWFCVCFDHMFNGNYAVNDAIWFNLETNNIFSYIKDSILYRDYLIENNQIKKEKFSFYKLKRNQSGIIRRTEPKNVSQSLKKVNSDKNEVWAEKDLYALADVLFDQDLGLLIDYFKCLDTLISTQPYVDLNNKKLANSKFCWAINIDSLEVFTQQELIPNGFE
jgi:hypothetical protein